MKSIHLTNAYHPSSGGIRTVYRAVLDAANRLERYVRLIVPGPRRAMEEVGPFGRIYHVKARQAFAFDSRYRVILPGSYLWPDPDGVAAILRAEQPDLVEVCDKLSLFYLAGLLRKGWMPGVRRPVLVGLSAERFDDIIRAYVSPGRPAQHFARWYMAHIYAPMFDYHVANSEYTAAELRAVLPPHRQRVVHVCPPGVDPEAFSVAASPERRRELRQQIGATDRSVVLLYAGRLSPEKNVRLLLDALAILVATETPGGRDYRLVLAGDGPLLDDLRRDSERRCPGRVSLLGNIAERGRLRSILAGSDALVHPNPREPFGIAPLEAMAAGVPVVLPDSGGVLTYASHETAWLTPATPLDFAAAIRRMACSPQRAADRTLRARERAAEFNFPQRIDQTFRLYDGFRHELTGLPAADVRAFRRRARALASHGR